MKRKGRKRQLHRYGHKNGDRWVKEMPGDPLGKDICKKGRAMELLMEMMEVALKMLNLREVDCKGMQQIVKDTVRGKNSPNSF